MADDLSEENVSHLRQMFAAADKDKDGYISTNEFFTITRLVYQRINQHITDAEMQALIDEFGAEDKDKIDFASFVKIIGPKLFTDECSNEDLREVFRCIDTDNDGFITAEELKQIILETGETCTDEEIAVLMQIVDSDGDGQRYDEYIQQNTENVIVENKKREELRAR
ncbi:calmodulin-like [Teleopsis dalmanni]|uniref:calmodulin-like n=1 Tax=Teleopsis dalmanni TaxID=139649 RepID=UPI0018CF0336|nr:calmodulin-like [Teleopsis dalmanni]